MAARASWCRPDFAATSEPLGTAKAGRSSDLDALAAYVASLDDFGRSPHRTANGELSAAATAGAGLFTALNCQSCHSGSAFTDQQRHDVGTIVASSGTGAGQALAGAGFKTPSLLGAWRTAPYFHNGSAATLADVVDSRHGGERALAAAERDQLVAYLQSLERPVAAADPLTAEIIGLPTTHDGRTQFSFRLEFSKEVTLSFTALFNDLFELTGARVSHMIRLRPPSSQSWHVTLQPAGDGPVVIVLPADRDCTEPLAVCTTAGERLAERLAVSVAGPRPASGAGRQRLGGRQPGHGGRGRSLLGKPRFGTGGGGAGVGCRDADRQRAGGYALPTSVRFEIGERNKTLALPSEDDATGESDSTVTVTLQSGAGYTLGAASSAEVMVEDNDAAFPVITGAATFTVVEGETSVATLTATDADTQSTTLTWSIPAGTAGWRGREQVHAQLRRSASLWGGQGLRGSGRRRPGRTVPGHGAGERRRGDGHGGAHCHADEPQRGADSERGRRPGGHRRRGEGDLGRERLPTRTPSDELTYAWTQTGGPDVVLSDSAALAAPTFTAPTGLAVDATLTFALRVTDRAGLFHEDAISVIVKARPPPVATIAAGRQSGGGRHGGDVHGEPGPGGAGGAGRCRERDGDGSRAVGFAARDGGLR